jgi:hypothetical protein
MSTCFTAALMYAVRWENRRDGRSGWMPPTIKGYWRKGMSRADAPYLPLTADVIANHPEFGPPLIAIDGPTEWLRPVVALVVCDLHADAYTGLDTRRRNRLPVPGP